MHCFPHSARNACDRARGPHREGHVCSRSARLSQVRGPTSPPRPIAPSAMAFVPCAPLRCRASSSNPGPRCFHQPRLRRLSARTLADRRPVMTSQSTADVPPAVVLLPGMDGTALLAEQFRAALDPTTCLVEAAYPPDELLDTVELGKRVVPAFAATAREMHPTGRYVLVAQSFSGHVALQYAATRPAGLAGIVLVNGFTSTPLPPLATASLLAAAGPPEWLFRAQPPPEIVARALLGGGSAAAVELAREVQAAVGTVSPAVLRHRARLCLTADSASVWADRSLLSPRGVRALYLAGAADSVVANTAHAAEMRATRRDLGWARVPGAPHLALQAAPAATARVVEAFLTSVASPAAVGGVA